MAVTGLVWPEGFELGGMVGPCIHAASGYVWVDLADLPEIAVPNARAASELVELPSGQI